MWQTSSLLPICSIDWPQVLQLWLEKMLRSVGIHSQTLQWIAYLCASDEDSNFIQEKRESMQTTEADTLTQMLPWMENTHRSPHWNHESVSQRCSDLIMTVSPGNWNMSTYLCTPFYSNVTEFHADNLRQQLIRSSSRGGLACWFLEQPQIGISPPQIFRYTN